MNDCPHEPEMDDEELDALISGDIIFICLSVVISFVAMVGVVIYFAFFWG